MVGVQRSCEGAREAPHQLAWLAPPSLLTKRSPFCPVGVSHSPLGKLTGPLPTHLHPLVETLKVSKEEEQGDPQLETQHAREDIWGWGKGVGSCMGPQGPLGSSRNKGSHWPPMTTPG